MTVDDLNGQPVAIGDQVFYTPRRSVFPVLARVVEIRQKLTQRRWNSPEEVLKTTLRVRPLSRDQQPLAVKPKWVSSWDNFTSPRRIEKFLKAPDHMIVDLKPTEVAHHSV